MKAQLSESLACYRRLLILRMLQVAPGYVVPGDVLADVLERYGHRVATEVWRNDLEHLATLCLVELRAGWIAALTVTGADVASGRLPAYGVSLTSRMPDACIEAGAARGMQDQIDAALKRGA